MRRYKPGSWSQQARIMADRAFEYFVMANECGDPESWLLEPDRNGYTCADVERHIHTFSNSYRADIVKNRAAKRFGRLVRKYMNQK